MNMRACPTWGLGGKRTLKTGCYRFTQGNVEQYTQRVPDILRVPFPAQPTRHFPEVILISEQVVPYHGWSLQEPVINMIHVIYQTRGLQVNP
jgi:hypothetical protein